MSESNKASAGTSSASIPMVIPKQGPVYSQPNVKAPVMCKPKIMTLKSAALLKQEETAKQAQQGRPTTGAPAAEEEQHEQHHEYGYA
ncbi:hypothetical protein PTSG_12228 [Salpingoeca rosetta]|uniref:Uncharacterized protein n=1 Tax=Salpingoeca rosetta (strain ATCC 50818 / BSB-021) TaxID=946362 RepID=F2U942_SALR5|nr:uncharacterized protein PTSG_12228 [Salpingoeca rosetta]EGD73245.1 hypothetical protein PTSG_12228 [Salpingoeca rosetta]|eukprot:XP_004994276.1 hypothetical protein PTSG_12228 [Salpingoeca rosetta]